MCVSKLTIISLDNGLSPGRRQAIIWTNAGILLQHAIICIDHGLIYYVFLGVDKSTLLCI